MYLGIGLDTWRTLGLLSCAWVAIVLFGGIFAAAGIDSSGSRLFTTKKGAILTAIIWAAVGAVPFLAVGHGFAAANSDAWEKAFVSYREIASDSKGWIALQFPDGVPSVTTAEIVIERKIGEIRKHADGVSDMAKISDCGDAIAALQDDLACIRGMREPVKCLDGI